MTRSPAVTADGIPAQSAAAIAEVAGGTTIAQLPDRDLDQAELLDLAASIAMTPEIWRKHIAFDDEARHYVSLYRDAHVDIWVLCWTPQNDTGWHDHDMSSGTVAVVQGRLVERKLSLGAASIATAV